MVVFGDTVEYVTRVSPTRKDPRGMGDPSTPTNPANFGRRAAIVQKVLANDRLAITIIGINIDIVVEKFDALNPKFNTWRERVP